jgi:hypothetical protein
MVDQPEWEPDVIPEDAFHDEGWANINRVPYDRISEVIYKRAMNIKVVGYEPARPAPEMPESWQGQGMAVVRWLFSEYEGTEEGLLQGARFAFLKEVTLEGGVSTGQRAATDHALIVTVISGEGVLYHRPTDGSPVVARPLRVGDAVLVYPGELLSLANEAEAELRLMIVGLYWDAEGSWQDG